MKCKSIYLQHFSMHKNTTSYIKLRRLKCVDLYTQGQCVWWRGTWNYWRIWLEKEHVLRVLWWTNIWYINPWCILVNIFLNWKQLHTWIAFGMWTPSKFFKGSTCWGKVQWEKWEVIKLWRFIIHITFHFLCIWSYSFNIYYFINY